MNIQGSVLVEDVRTYGDIKPFVEMFEHKQPMKLDVLDKQYDVFITEIDKTIFDAIEKPSIRLIFSSEVSK